LAQLGVVTITFGDIAADGDIAAEGGSALPPLADGHRYGAA
jgi:hypothetical protein